MVCLQHLLFLPVFSVSLWPAAFFTPLNHWCQNNPQQQEEDLQGEFGWGKIRFLLCLLWRLKLEFWMVCMCIQAGEKCIQGFEPTWSITISVAFMKSMLDMCTTDFWSSWQSFCSILRHIWWSNCFTLHANVFLKRHTTLCVFHYFVVSL